mmetsp:Transcript_17976/g.36213  ORF Transcript_17976/g.36213 Transcript_17976/m.36213 type:complete len:443 (+) Transcript_17976:107-1435(+)
MPAAKHEGISSPCNVEEQHIDEADDCVIVITELKSPFRILGTSKNWEEVFGTATNAVVGRGINIIYGPKSEATVVSGIMKEAFLSNSTSGATQLYDSQGTPKMIRLLGKPGPDLDAPTVCTLFMYTAKSTYQTLTNGVSLTLSHDDVFRIIACEGRDGKGGEFSDLVGQNFLNVYKCCFKDMSRLRNILRQTVGSEACPYRETLEAHDDVGMGPVDVRMFLSQPNRASEKVITVEMGSTCTPERTQPKLPPFEVMDQASGSESAFRGPRELHLLLREGSGFPSLSGDAAYVMKLALGTHQVESTPQESNSPLWNEMHQLVVEQLPCVVRVTALIRSHPTASQLLRGQDHEREELLVGTGDILLTDRVLHGFTDDWVQVQIGGKRSKCKVRISFSFEQKTLEQLKRGLHPTGASKFNLCEFGGQSPTLTHLAHLLPCGRCRTV